jgi:hypothetical protein
MLVDGAVVDAGADPERVQPGEHLVTRHRGAPVVDEAREEMERVAHDRGRRRGQHERQLAYRD